MSDTPAPARRIRRRRRRTAFVLSGGGNLGALQVGQLRALLERGIEPDIIVGCSVGALNGVGFAANPTQAGIDHMAEVWAEASAKVMPSSRVPAAVQIVRKGASLYPSDGLRTTVHRVLGAARTFDDLRVEFQCVATDVDAGAEAWFESGDLADAVMASAALPSVYPMVTIGGRRYLDGGVLNNVPVSRAVELGAHTVVVLTVGRHGRPQPDVRRPVDAALIAYWIARNARVDRDLAELPSSVDAIVLPVGPKPELRFDDFTQSETLIRQGYVWASRALDDIAAAPTGALAQRLSVERWRMPDWRGLAERMVGRRESTTAPSHEDVLVPEAELAEES